MNIAEFITEKIMSEYRGGMTQWDLAHKYHVTQSHIQKIVSGQRKVSGLTLDTIMKMFPSATIDLTGHGNLGNQQINRDQATGIQNINTAPPPSLPSEDQCAACRHRLQDAVMSSDMDAASKVKAYGIIGGGGDREGHP